VNGDNPRDADLIDVNGDGHLDILTANYDNVSVLLNNGSGTFTHAAASPVPIGGQEPYRVLAADLNGDGRPDLVTTNRYSDNLSVLLNTTEAATGSPVVQPDKTIILNEDVPQALLDITAPTDPEGDPLTITVTALPNSARGQVLFAGGTAVAPGQELTIPELTGLKFVPALNANGAAGTFAYTVSDGNSGLASQTVTLQITAINDAPVAQNEGFATFQATPVGSALPGVLANDSDVDGNPLTAVLVTPPANGAFTLNPNGSFAYTPPVGFSGAASFTYRASDGSASSDLATVTIQVSPDPPASSSNVTIDASGSLAVPGGTASFNLQVRRSTNKVQGSVSYLDPARSKRVSSTQLTAVVVTGRAARIFGRGVGANGAPVTFVVDLDDLAEPGRFRDTFRIEVSTGFTVAGSLATGNVRVNR
jgi:hypothetical protein